LSLIIKIRIIRLAYRQMQARGEIRLSSYRDCDRSAGSCFL